MSTVHEQKRERKIYSAIQESGKIRYSELKRKIVDEMKIVSERPFRETLNNMATNGLIIRNEIDRQNVVYTINKKISNLDKSNIDKIISSFSDLDDAFKELENKIKKLSDIEKAEEILSFLKFLSNQEIHWSIFGCTMKNTKLKKHVENIQKLKRKTIELATKDSQYELNEVSSLISLLLNLEVFGNSKDPIAKLIGAGIKSSIRSKKNKTK